MLWFLGAMVPCFLFAVLAWCFFSGCSGALVLLWAGALVSECRGALVLYCPGVLGCSGVLVHPAKAAHRLTLLSHVSPAASTANYTQETALTAPLTAE